MITITGKAGIKATILADSLSEAGIRMLTFEIEYPRLVLAELNTHRGFSKNSASSRAIPFAKMATQLTGRPVSFGANQSGMQAGSEHNANIPFHDGYGTVNTTSPEDFWDYAKDIALSHSEAFSIAGYHKQVFNRLTEPFQMMKTVIGGTETGNFFWLRDDDAADPTLHELARCMREAAASSTPRLLLAGQWHLPYVDVEWDADGNQHFYITDSNGLLVPLTIEQAIKVSCARCAAVSYRNEGYGLEKSHELYERLVGAVRKHASALEHCATPMALPVVAKWKLDRSLNIPHYPWTWQPGISHMDRDEQLWSGNIRGWIQHRKLIVGENKEGGV